MTQAEMEQGFRELWKMFAETDKRLDQRFRETERVIQETSEQIKATDKKVHVLTDKWGLFVEGLVVPAAKKMFQERGIEIKEVYHRAEAARNGQSMEVDVLAAGGDYAVLIEAKSTLKVEDVNEHIERLRRFKEFFPRYSDTITIGAVAGIVISEDADKYAYKQGFYVIAQSGDTVKILNDDQFQPILW